MKLTIMVSGLLVVSSTAAYAQGTIQFLNSGLSKIAYAASPEAVVQDAPIGTVVGIFWGTNSSLLALQTPTVTINTTPGVFSGGATYALPGTSPGQQVYLKFAAWLNSGGATPPTAPQGAASPGITHYGESIVVLTTALGSAIGPGTVVWQNPSGTSLNRAKPFTMGLLSPRMFITRNTLTANLPKIDISGVFGLNYSIQASTNLITPNWVSLATNGSPFTYVDGDALRYPRRYYRAVFVP